MKDCSNSYVHQWTKYALHFLASSGPVHLVSHSALPPALEALTVQTFATEITATLGHAKHKVRKQPQWSKARIITKQESVLTCTYWRYSNYRGKKKKHHTPTPGIVLTTKWRLCAGGQLKFYVLSPRLPLQQQFPSTAGVNMSGWHL